MDFKKEAHVCLVSNYSFFFSKKHIILIYQTFEALSWGHIALLMSPPVLKIY